MSCIEGIERLEEIVISRRHQTYQDKRNWKYQECRYRNQKELYQISDGKRRKERYSNIEKENIGNIRLDISEI